MNGPFRPPVARLYRRGYAEGGDIGADGGDPLQGFDDFHRSTSDIPIRSLTGRRYYPGRHEIVSDMPPPGAGFGLLNRGRVGVDEPSPEELPPEAGVGPRLPVGTRAHMFAPADFSEASDLPESTQQTAMRRAIVSPVEARRQRLLNRTKTRAYDPALDNPANIIGGAAPAAPGDFDPEARLPPPPRTPVAGFDPAAIEPEGASQPVGSKIITAAPKRIISPDEVDADAEAAPPDTSVDKPPSLMTPGRRASDFVGTPPLDITAPRRSISPVRLITDPDELRFLQQDNHLNLNPGQQAGSLQDAWQIAHDKQYKQGRDFKVELQNRVRSALGPEYDWLHQLTPEAQRHLVPLMLNDAFHALETNPGAIGWYDKTVNRALALTALHRPEVMTDPNAALMYKISLAITSNGMKVDRNFQLNDKIYERWYNAYKKSNTGFAPFPTDMGEGTAAEAMNKTFARANDLIAQHGYEGADAFLNKTWTVGELKKQGWDVSGEYATTPVRGYAVFGPKIGNGFMANLNKYFDALTIDRWNMRSWGRWTGRLLDDRPEMVNKSFEQLSSALSRMSPQERMQMEGIVGAELDPMNPQSYLPIIKASQDKQVREEQINPLGGGLGNEARLAARKMDKYVGGHIEQPESPAQRIFMRDTYSKVLAALHLRGMRSMTMADLQALLWYPEKLLYRSVQMPAGKSKRTYVGDEIPDYARAAEKVAREKGVSDAEIQSTLAQHPDVVFRQGRRSRLGR